MGHGERNGARSGLTEGRRIVRNPHTRKAFFNSFFSSPSIEDQRGLSPVRPRSYVHRYSKSIINWNVNYKIFVNCGRMVVRLRHILVITSSIVICMQNFQFRRKFEIAQSTNGNSVSNSGNNSRKKKQPCNTNWFVKQVKWITSHTDTFHLYRYKTIFLFEHFLFSTFWEPTLLLRIMMAVRHTHRPCTSASPAETNIARYSNHLQTLDHVNYIWLHQKYVSISHWTQIENRDRWNLRKIANVIKSAFICNKCDSLMLIRWYEYRSVGQQGSISWEADRLMFVLWNYNIAARESTSLCCNSGILCVSHAKGAERRVRTSQDGEPAERGRDWQIDEECCD